MSDHLPESFSLASIWLNKACTTRKDSESECLAKDNPETNPITIKPETSSHSGRAVLLGSLTLLLSTWVPFPNKISCFVSTCVSLDNSFMSIKQELSFRLWKGYPFLQQNCKESDRTKQLSLHFTSVSIVT